MPSCRWKPIRALFQTPGVPCCHAVVSDEGVRESDDSPCDTVTLCLKDFGSASGAWPTLSLRECQEYAASCQTSMLRRSEFS